MRLGGPVLHPYHDPDAWVAEAQAKGYRAVYCPVGLDAPEDEIRAYARAAQEADLVIAEVGAWSNPISRDAKEREAALDKCKRGLALAEQIGARCCVNIAGSRGTRWDGPHAENLASETFDLIVATVQEIIDAVQPARTCYALETMPWMYPDSPDSYVWLIEAIGRRAFAVHFDPVNLVCSPQRYYDNGALVREFVHKLGPHIRSCHAKDTILRDRLTVHLDEARPGLGNLDYALLLKELAALDRDLPLMLEHLPNEQEYDLAAEHIRAVAAREGVSL